MLQSLERARDIVAAAASITIARTGRGLLARNAFPLALHVRQLCAQVRARHLTWVGMGRGLHGHAAHGRRTCGGGARVGSAPCAPSDPYQPWPLLCRCARPRPPQMPRTSSISSMHALLRKRAAGPPERPTTRYTSHGQGLGLGLGSTRTSHGQGSWTCAPPYPYPTPRSNSPVRAVRPSLSPPA